MDVRLPQRPYCRYRHLQYDSYDPLAQVRDWTTEDGESRQQTNYFHCDQIGIPREMTDKDGNLLWFYNYTGWGCLKEETKVKDSDTTPFACRISIPTLRRGCITTSSCIISRMRGGLLIRTRFDWWGDAFAPNTQDWFDLLGLCSNSKLPNADKAIIDPRKITGYDLNTEHPVGGKSKGFSICIRI